MNKLFGLDSPIMQALSRLADLIILSFLWLVCCLPVVTIGPASAAMCFVAMNYHYCIPDLVAVYEYRHIDE